MFRHLLAAAAGAALIAGPFQAHADWQPDRPITVIVPWGAGGSTDQIVRLLATQLEDELGTTLVIVNQPGASGSIGTRSVLEAPRDGYTWASGAAKDVGTYAVTGSLDTAVDDWHYYLGVINAAMISVNANQPYQTLDELIEAMQADPGGITVANAGINSSGGAALGSFSTSAGVEARSVTYDGGNPAVIATAGGETVATTQLASEQAEMVRAGRLRPLAVISSVPLDLEGYGEVPPITDFLPDYPVSDNYFGIFIPVGVPDEVVATMDRIWAEVIANSEAVSTYANRQGAIKAVLYGQEARDAIMPAVKDFAWGLWERNEAAVDPATVGIPPR